MKLHKGWKLLILGLFLILVVPFLLQRVSNNSEDKFVAPKENAQTVQFQIGENATFDGITNNLAYYGFIKDEDAFKEAVLKSKDNF